MKKTKAPRDPDHRAAWLACKKPEPDPIGPGEMDMRKLLKKALGSGWTIRALKAYAYISWRIRGLDHVTPVAWRWAVMFAHDAMGHSFRDRYLANPEPWDAVVK